MLMKYILSRKVKLPIVSKNMIIKHFMLLNKAGININLINLSYFGEHELIKETSR